MTAKRTTKSMFKEIEVDQIDRPETISRLEIDEQELKELAESIKERGLLQPIEVVQRDGRYKIVFGDRRYLAHKMLKKKKIMCRVVEITDKEMVIDRALENAQRVNLTPFEEAHVYHDLRERGEMGIPEISKRMGKSGGVIIRYLDILRMPESFQKALHSKQINMGVAEELWSCKSPEKREYFLDLAVEHGITVAIARTWVQDYNRDERGKKRDVGGGGSEFGAFENVPIYRACDVCKDPVNTQKSKNFVYAQPVIRAFSKF